MVELRTGFPLLIQQLIALLKKNVIVAWRHKRTTFLRLFSSLFFLFLMFCIDKSNNVRSGKNKDVIDEQTLISAAIPPCEEKFSISLSCYDFVWSGNASVKVQSIVNSIMANNPGRPIPPSKVRSFGKPEEVDAWLFKDPMYCPAALHFFERNATVISYGIQTNSTITTKRGKTEDITFKFQIPLQIAAEREIARSLLGDSKINWVIGFKEFPHHATSAATGSSLESVGPAFFFAIAMFGFVSQIGSLVVEKELKLRQAMSMMGLYETSYWLSWLIWEPLISLLSSLFTVFFGIMLRFDLFLHNSFVILFLVFALFQLSMIGFAFMISNFISNSSSASTVGFSIFIIGFFTQLVTLTFGFPYSKSTSTTYRAIWSLFPPNLLAKALNLLLDSTSTAQNMGITWATRANCPDDSCVITIDGIYKWLVSTFVLWTFLAIYFDNIFPNSYGVRKPLLYFLMLGYWTGKGGHKVEEGGFCGCARSIPQVEDAIPNDGDVREEENIVKQQVSDGVFNPNVAVQIRGLAKTFPGKRKIRCCCKCTRTPYHAIKGLWVNFPKDQLFCLLGPNGAGKTTTMNCLTGITPVSSGDALIYGYSIRSSVGMSNIRRMIGVCPQFDILWDDLSGEEHLHLFASIKGLPPSLIKSVAQDLLAKVKVTHASKMRAGSYSGGMKRRISVAIALIGDPKLVLLDEPTTGMDPITRRHVWDIIEDAKKGRAIVLTTHSMEEADILSDRIAIMAKGKLRCIGTSIRLKSRFGSGFIATVGFTGSTPGQSSNVNGAVGTSSGTHHDAVKQFFKQRLNVVPKEENMSFLTFVIPHEKEGLLTNFFAELEYREWEFGISDIQLGLTTLEEVFLNIANKAELESAVAEGILVTLKLKSGASLQIPKGARFIGIPGTVSAEHPRGMMVEVYWEQDENGAFCISGHSSETPIPPSVHPMASHLPSSQRTNLGRNRQVQGLVIDPRDIEV